MYLIKPSYYDRFHCIGGDCSDSCCKDWDVSVDPGTYDFYCHLDTPLGDKLREVLYEEDGIHYIGFPEGHCPLWRADGLCALQAELGESALSQTCREFPRLTHDYGNFIEKGLELSCPEAARIILSSPAGAPVTTEVSGGEAPGYDAEAMDILLQSRETLRCLLEDRSLPVSETLAAALLYAYQVQGQLDGGEALPFDPAEALEEAHALAAGGDAVGLLAFFESLEIMTPQWTRRLRAPAPGSWHDGYRNLARYFADRYWLQAVSDYDLVSRAKLMVISCLVIHTLGGDFTDTAHLYSKEIENDADNIDAILDGAYTAPALTDAKIFSLLFE